MKLNIKKILKKNINFKELFELKTARNKIIIGLFLSISTFLFFLFKDSIVTINDKKDLMWIIISCFGLLFGILGFFMSFDPFTNFFEKIDNFLYKKDYYYKSKIEKFKFFRKNINLGILLDHYDELYQYFKNNECEEEFNSLIRDYYLSGNIIKNYYFSSFISKIAKNKKMHMIDFFYSIEEDLKENLNIKLFKLFKKDIIFYELFEFMTYHNLNTENGRKVYLYLKEQEENEEDQLYKYKEKIKEYIKEYEKNLNQENNIAFNLNMNLNPIYNF